MTIVRLAADDLTGALDSAAQFTGAIGPFPVALGLGAVPTGGSFALDLGCRDGSEAAAVAKAAAAAPHLLGGDIAYKKIDSLLRGHWVAELAAVVRMGLFRHVVVAPAFPKQGRITRGGRQFTRGTDGQWQPLAIDPVQALAKHGVPAALGFQQPISGNTAQVMVCDAERDADLDKIVAASFELEGPTLFCGSAGLARALAGAPPIGLAPAPGPHLVLVGSNHPISLGQMAILDGKHPEWMIRFDDDAAASALAINQSLDTHGRCVAVAALPAGIAPAEAAARIADRLSRLVQHLRRPSALTVVGGETFAALCAGLGTDIVLVEGEWRPGVPMSRLVGGPWDATPCVSKSGAFGAPDVLIELLAGSSTASGLPSGLRT